MFFLLGRTHYYTNAVWNTVTYLHGASFRMWVVSVFDPLGFLVMTKNSRRASGGGRRGVGDQALPRFRGRRGADLGVLRDVRVGHLRGGGHLRLRGGYGVPQRDADR